jgi:hypothetical protein
MHDRVRHSWRNASQSDAVVIFSFCLLATILVSATEPSPGVLSVEDVKRVMQSSYFFRGQSAPVEGTILPPIEYGFGFSKDGKFLVTDVGANDLFTVAAHLDENPALGRPLDDRGGPKLSEPKFIPALRRQEMGQPESTVRDLEVSPTKAATNRIPV